MISNQGTVLKITAQDPAMPMTAEVIAQKNIVSCTWKVEDANHVTKAIGEALVSGTSAHTFQPKCGRWHIRSYIIFVPT